MKGRAEFLPPLCGAAVRLHHRGPRHDATARSHRSHRKDAGLPPPPPTHTAAVSREAPPAFIQGSAHSRAILARAGRCHTDAEVRPRGPSAVSGKPLQPQVWLTPRSILVLLNLLHSLGRIFFFQPHRRYREEAPPFQLH